MRDAKVGRTEEPGAIEHQWRNVFRLGGYAALLSFCGTLVDIVIGSVASADLTVLPHTALERFVEFNQNWLLGLYHLDLLNVITTFVMILAYFALFGLHRKRNLPYAAFAMLLYAIGTTIFVTSNAALPMLELANRYYAVADQTQRMFITAAGEALLARGAHGSLGVFLGFSLSSLAAICMSLVMLHGQIFGKKTSYCGVIGHTLLLVYILLVTFIPTLQSIAVAMAAPGGILALVWTLLVGIKLLRMEAPPTKAGLTKQAVQ